MILAGNFLKLALMVRFYETKNKKSKRVCRLKPVEKYG